MPPQPRLQAMTTQINRPERTMPTNSRESARVQPQLLTGQDADTINNQLLRVAETLEVARQKLFETRYIATEALQDLDQERQIRQRCSDAYQELHIQYGRKVDEMFEMTTKCLTLNEELDKAQKAIATYDSNIVEEKAQLREQIGELEGSMARLSHQVEILIHSEQSARQIIAELEEEKENLVREHGKTINMMAAREALATQKADELQKGVDKWVQEREAAMNTTVERRKSTEGVADTIRNKHEGSVVGKQRKSGEPKQKSLRPIKYRKCKGAAEVEDDTIEVRN